MKPNNFYVAIFIIFLTIVFPSFAAGQIIDHRCRDISIIPATYIYQVKMMILHHTGQSHGRQVPHGLENLESEDSTYSQTQGTEGIPQGAGLKITRGQRRTSGNWSASIDTDQYWEGESGKDYTRRTLNYHRDQGVVVNATLHTWCWDLRTWSESQVVKYLSSMTQLEQEYPDTTFIYMTDTADKKGDRGYNRWLRNEQIRTYCRDNGKVLFDFADLETWSADGSQQHTYQYNGHTIPLWHPDWQTAPFYNDGHINEAACTMKAKAMWWLLAVLAGWDPDCGLAAEFSANPTAGAAPLTVSFTDASTGETDDWLWNFGDGQTAMTANPIHTYEQPEKYTVTLIVSNTNCSDRKVLNNGISVSGEIAQSHSIFFPIKNKAGKVSFIYLE